MDDPSRDRLRDRVRTDLVGPGSREEVLAEHPTDRYLTGILYCQDEAVPDEENTQAPQVADRDEQSGETSREEVGLHHAFRPSSMGLSFEVPKEVDRLDITIAGGRYKQRWKDEEGNLTETNLGREHRRWKREPLTVEMSVPVGEPGFDTEKIGAVPDGGVGPMLELGRQVDRLGPERHGVTIVLSNLATKGSAQLDTLHLYQAEIRVSAGDGGFLARAADRPAEGGRDARVNALLYRNRSNFASGHTCSVGWTEEEGRCAEIRSRWLPSSTVYPISHEGDQELAELVRAEDSRLFGAQWLAGQEDVELLCDRLERLPARYQEWIDRHREKADGLRSSFFVEQAHENLDHCEESCERMRSGIEVLRNDPTVRRAFRLSQEAMDLQHRSEGLEWRPFQLGFQLQSLASLADRRHPDRAKMDLLWFPTGGGKTEAYLGLAAFTLLHRRLRDETEDGDGGGVGVVTRYTLRLLTIQQFERSARVICACEALRSGLIETGIDTAGLGKAPFTIGFWAGTSATPNTRRRAKNHPARSRLLVDCPWCGATLPRPEHGEYRPECDNPDCAFGERESPLPVLTVDEDIYETPPSMLIGTIDKFAQIVRKEETGRLFGVGTEHAVPDLIIQDELHLISGPLGSIAALYEGAFDALCRELGEPPKVLGSTATIRGARDQVRSLFNREVTQFPAPAIDAENSFFAVEDRSQPGRKYVGVTTAGRSAPFTRQALSASLLQGGKGLLEAGADPEDVDPYWTLVAYFNSLRELGGSLSLMEDDVRESIKVLSDRRDEEWRPTDPPTELSSRVASEEIPRILDDLKVGLQTGRPLDTVLATNMISVGMDVPRLGLMMVNGQPKTMAEYIQATSRVGRRHPGLILTIFNAMKTRDRSRFESFPGWHGTLYREVEASSVTPFAPRARDRALRMAIIALCRHLVPGMGDDPTLTPERRRRAEKLADRIVERTRQVDPKAAEEVEDELHEILEEWASRGTLDRYWATGSSHADRSLLVGAEDHAAAGGDGSGHWTSDLWPALNSMREVEAGVEFRLAPRSGGRS